MVTLVAVPIVVERADGVGAALDRAIAVAGRGADLIEWRIDPLLDGESADATHAAVRRLVERSPRPCIVTCRDIREGGAYDGPDEARWDLLDAVVAADAPPRFVDVELRAARARPDRLRGLAGRCGDRTTIILSVHDLDGRPADLLQRLEAMAVEPACGVIKLAWRARSLRDNLEALDLLADRPKPMIALCMGSFGLPSRVLAPKVGGLLTFAADAPGLESAAGQPSLDELRGLYRFDAIGPGTRVYGVIGWPVAHSRGPQVHNAGFERLGFDGVYLPLPVPPEPVHFKATVGAMLDHPRLAFGGASVTLPHKGHALRLVRERGGHVDPLAARIGAANTLVVDGHGRLSCLNTDCPAAVEAVCAAMGIERPGLRGLNAAVLGAGGVARAVAVGLASAGATVTIVNRTPDRAAALARELTAALADDPGAASIDTGDAEEMRGRRFAIVVNGTSVGMTGGPAPEASPLERLELSIPLDEGVTVLDTVYTPRHTPLLQAAENAGARTVDGEAMFMRQAALQLEAWVGG